MYCASNIHFNGYYYEYVKYINNGLHYSTHCRGTKFLTQGIRKKRRVITGIETNCGDGDDLFGDLDFVTHLNADFLKMILFYFYFRLSLLLKNQFSTSSSHPVMLLLLYLLQLVASFLSASCSS